jgi:protein-tyrosine phosphatase
MDERAAAVLRANDYDPTAHRAQQFSATWLESNDLVLAMDAGNLTDVRRVESSSGAPADAERVRLFGDFDPVEPGGEVPDPYYGGAQGFEEVLSMVERTCAVLVSALQQLPELRDPPATPAGSAS